MATAPIGPGAAPANTDARSVARQELVERAFEEIATSILVLDASQLLDHDDNLKDIRLGTAMFTQIADRVIAHRKAIDASYAQPEGEA
jgi:hypothetical protein